MTWDERDSLDLTSEEMDELDLTADQWDNLSYEEVLAIAKEKLERFKD